jgi:hypothetical protein
MEITVVKLPNIELRLYHVNLDMVDEEEYEEEDEEKKKRKEKSFPEIYP